MNLLNQSRQEGKGEPQWLLDALTTLGVPYSIVSQTATIANHTVLSPEKFKEAREKMQATINEWNAVLFSKENVEKLQGLWENICKQYETERVQALEALQGRLERGNLEALSEEDLAFYNQTQGFLMN